MTKDNHIKQVFILALSIISSLAAIIGITLAFKNLLLSISIFLLCLTISSLLVVLKLRSENKKILSEMRIPVAGIVHFFPKRSDLDSEWWEKFFCENKKPENVYLMGHSMSKTFVNTKQAKAFVKWCSQEKTKLRILFLSPANTELSQLQNIGRGMKEPLSEDPVENLKKKILNSIDNLERNVISNVKKLDLKPLVRYATCDLPYSVMAVDDEMVVTPYATEPEADEQPTFIINDRTSKAYKSFIDEFERIWEKHSKVSPHEDPVISQLKRDWNIHIRLRDYDSPLLPPKQAIIYTTYQCDEKCPDCMFKQIRMNDYPKEMEVDTFKSIVKQLSDIGVKQFEISGGGEPLEHSEMNKLLDYLREMKNRNSEFKFGLLTNGSNLNEFDPQSILEVFNDYIRISRYHRLSETGRENEFHRWKENIQNLQRLKQANPQILTRIGLKYLLSPSNKDKFVQMIKMDMEDRALRNMDHIRIRASREINGGLIASLEQQVYYVIRDVHIPNFEDKVSISLPHVNYPRNFRCWISPMNVVIAPNGQVFICCNYLNDERSKALGKINGENFKNIWYSQRHYELRKNLNRDNCNKNWYCDCRWAELQNVYEKIDLTVRS